MPSTVLSRARSAAQIISVLALTVLVPVLVAAQAPTVTVTTEAELRTVLLTASSVTTIEFANNITLTADLPAVTFNVTIDGKGFTLSGGSQYRGLFVASVFPTTTSPPWVNTQSPITVTVQNLTIMDTVAKGGNGGTGSAGGGGGAGMGGALFVGDLATVTVTNVNVVSSSAVGGAGGAGGAGAAGGGGGGLGGNGGAGDAFSGSGGGGGGIGVGADGGVFNGSPGAGIFNGLLWTGVTGGGGGGGSLTPGASGGLLLPPVGTPTVFGGGGGGGGGSATPAAGGAGGIGGGGGGAYLGALGAAGGAGGFGGGGGGSAGGAAGAGGTFGGAGADASGGGGAGLGGAVFVVSGGALQVAGAFTVNGSSVTGGSGAIGAGSGSAFGSGLYLDGDGTLGITTDSTVTIPDVIADGAGSGGAGSWGITKGGTGTLVLSGNNTYTRETGVSAGTLSVAADRNLGSATADLSIYSGATLQITGSDTFSRNMWMLGDVTVGVTSGQTATWNGQLAGIDLMPASLRVTGGGTLALTNGTNAYSIGTSVIGNSTLAITSDGALGGGDVTLGDASSSATLRIDGPSTMSSRGFSLGAAGATFDIVGSTDAMLAGEVSGAGGLTKIGTGTLALGGPNTYAGATTVNAGTIRADAADVFGTSPSLTVASAGAIDLNGFNQNLFSISGAGSIALGTATLTVGSDNSSSTFDGTITGQGGLFKSGTGTLTLSGANTFDGALTLQAGTLRVASDANLGGAGTTVAMSDATTLDLTAGGTYAHPLAVFGTSSVNAGAGQTVTWSGAISDNASPGALRLAGGGTFALTNTGNAYSGGTIVTDGSTLNVGADAAMGATTGGLTLGEAATSATLAITGNLSSSRTIGLGSLGATVDTAAGIDATLGGVMSGIGGLAKNGTGTLTLAGTNAYQGATAVNGGVLRAGSTAAFGLGSALSVGAGATADLNGFNQTISSISGSGTIALGGTATLAVGGDGSNSTFAGTISGTGGLAKDGSGILTLSGTNTFEGGLGVNAGTVRVANLGGAGAVAMRDATTLDLTSGGTFARALSVAGTSSLNAGAGQSVTWTGQVGDNGSAGTLRLTGGGTFALTNAGNSYSGGTIIAGGGTLNVNADGALGAATAGLSLGDATTTGTLGIGASTTIARAISLGSAGGTIGAAGGTTATLGGAISGAGALRLTGGGTFSVTNATNTYAGGTTVTGGSTLNFGDNGALGAAAGGLTLGDATTTGTLGIGASTTVARAITVGAAGGAIGAAGGTAATLGGAISGAGGLHLTGGGTFALTNATNTYSGGTIVTGGSRLNFGADGALGAAGAALTLGDATSTGTLGISASTTVARAIALGGVGGTVETAAATTTALSGIVSGSGGLIKTGGGTLALSGSNTFGGGLALDGGTLRVSSDANLGGAGTVAMSSATMLDFTGGGSYGHALSLAGLPSVNVGAGQMVTWNGQIGGTGTLRVTGGGTFAQTNTSNSYSGGTIVTGGSTLSVASDAALGAAGTGLTLGDATSTGTLGLSAPDGSFLSSRAITLGDAGGTVDVAGATAATLGGAISGPGGLTKSGDGTLWLTGANTYTGGTFLHGGSLITSATSLQGSVLTNTGLVFYQPTDATFRGFIGGAGGLTKLGTGTLTLNGLHGYTGLTWVREGGLFVDAGLPGSVMVDPGATLWAGGVIGGSLTVGGSLFVPAPSNQAATFNRTFFGANSTTGARTLSQVPTLVVNGDLTTAPGSTFSLWLTPDLTAPVVVNGVATLNDTHVQVNVSDPNPKRVTTYLGIAAAGGLHVNGGDVTSPSPLLSPVLNSQANALTVTVVNLGVPLPTPNAALDPATATGDFRRVMTEVWALDDATLASTVRSLSGEIHASEVRMVALDSLAMTDMVRNEISAREGMSERQVTGVASVRPWFDAGGDHVDFDGGSANTGGSGGGFDFKPASAWTLGGGGALSLGDLSLSGISGSSQMTSPRAFFYSGFSFGPFSVHWGGSRAWTTTSTNRQIQFVAYVPDAAGRPVPLFPGIPSGSSDRSGLAGVEPAVPRPGVDRRATAEERSTASDAWSEWQFVRKFTTWTMDTKLGLRVARFSRDGFTETGADSISLNGLGQTLKSNQTNFDFHLFRPKGTWRPNILVTYRREFGDNVTSANVNFAGNPDTPFSVQGFPMPTNIFQGLFGITMQSMGGLLYTLEYQTLQSSEESRHSVRFKVRLW